MRKTLRTEPLGCSRKTEVSLSLVTISASTNTAIPAVSRLSTASRSITRFLSCATSMASKRARRRAGASRKSK